MIGVSTTAEMLDAIVAALSIRCFRWRHEGDVQDAIAGVLEDADVAFTREVRLSDQDRIDFLVHDIGIEVKCEGSAGAVERQLARYAESPRISALVLATTRNQLRVLPDTVGGKPLRVAFLVRPWP